MGANPHVNGGRVLKALDLPDLAQYALSIPGPGEVVAEAPRKLGEYLRDDVCVSYTESISSKFS
jgi:xylulose-5-phosphate/fructose-6-phosphate phosphoketolase